MATSQDRLFGMLAVQLGFLDASTLKKHLHRRGQRELGLGAFLVKEGVLTHADVALLEACAAQSLKTHGGPAPALTALSRGAQAYTESFSGFDDTIGSGEHSTASLDSLEGLDFVVPELPGRYVDSSLPELGRGGLGRVLAIKDQVLGRTVALKELHGARSAAANDARSSLDQEARFLREARLSAQLEHPSIVPIYEAGRRLDGSLFYTMRRIEGRTLADALAAAKGLDARLKLMPHLVAMAQALAYAHSRDVLHRDVKPQNVMLGRFGETYNTTTLLSHYYRGEPIIEAYWKSVSMPGEGLFIGEPLATPWRHTSTWDAASQTFTLSTTQLKPGFRYAIDAAPSATGPWARVRTGISVTRLGRTTLSVQPASAPFYRLVRE